MSPPRKCWPIFRIIMALLTSFFIWCAVSGLWEGHKLEKDFEAWKVATPLNASIDLSTPGRHIFPFEQTCSSSHGEIVTVRIPTTVLNGISVKEALAPLVADIQIIEKSGTNLVTDGHAETFREDDAEWNGATPLFNLGRFRKGSYRAVITVTAGVPQLAGTNVTLEAKYMLCGLEKFPATIAIGLGTICLGLSLITVWFIFPNAKTKPIATTDRSEDPV